MIKAAARTMFASTVAAGLLAVSVTQAAAVSQSVKSACIADYLSYCSAHAPGGTAVRQCMRRHGAKLSKRCVWALVKAGYAAKADASRKTARLHP